MFFIMYDQTDEKIYQDIDEVAIRLVEGWKLFAYTDNEKFSYSLLHECKHY